MNLHTEKLAIAIVFAAALSGCERHQAPVPAAAAGAALTVAPWAAPSVTPPAGGSCALDSIAGKPAQGAQIKKGDVVMFAGWMGDAQGQVPAKALLVFKGAEGSYSLPLTGGGLRSDVAAALGLPGLGTSGYNQDGSVADVAAGAYSLSIVHGGDTPVACALNVTVTITP